MITIHSVKLEKALQIIQNYNVNKILNDMYNIYTSRLVSLFLEFQKNNHNNDFDGIVFL